MKKVIIVIGALLVLFIAALAIIPIVFKDEIKAKIDAEIAKNINAKVYFDAGKFELGIFRNFPNLTITMAEFGVVGNDEFEKDTLAAIGRFNVVVDVMSVIKGDKISVKQIILDNPRMLAKVLKNGKANWDITYPDSTKKEETESSAFAVGINKWEINNGHIRYIDETMPLYTELVNFNHSGSGDLTQDLFDLVTKTHIDAMTVDFAGVRYFNKTKFDMDMALAMDMANSKYTFKENVIKFNEFSMGFDGWLAMKDDMDMDITFKTKDNLFKSILSLVPGVYLEGFEKIKTDGKLSFDGAVKGKMTDTALPAYNVNLLVENAMFQYPELPTAVNNINVKMMVESTDGSTDNLLVNIEKFHMDLGVNPIDARLRVQGLDKMNLDANVKALLNLEDITKMFPVDGMALKGMFTMDVDAKGLYDETHLPAIAASMGLKNGYVKSKDFPAALENLNMATRATNATGEMKDLKVNIDEFNMTLDGEPITMKAYIENMDDINYDVDLHGSLDMTKLTKIFPLEGMTLAGKIIADITTKGKMSDVTAEKYDRLPTSGKMTFNDFTYSSPDMPQTLVINTAEMNFSPAKVEIKGYKGTLGKSDVALDGFVSNYMGWMFKPGETLKGSMNFSSKKFDTNEWMTEDENAPADTATAAFYVPDYIDFTLNSRLDEVIYDNMNITNMVGTIIIRDRAIKMQGINFETLGGKFGMNGTYDTKDTLKPTFDFDLNINNLAFKKAFETFNTVQKIAPIANFLDGKFNTNFKIAGEVGQDMMPVMTSLSGGGLINILEAALTNIPLLRKVTDAAQLKDSEKQAFGMKEVKTQAEIKDGKFEFKPINFTSGDRKMTLSGANSISDGAIDYLINLDLPTGAVGQAVSSQLSSLTGQNVSGTNRLKLDLKAVGPFSDPKVSIISNSVKDNATNVVTNIIDNKKDEAKAKLEAEKAAAEEKARQEIDKQKAEAEAKARAEADKLKAELEAKKKAEEERLRKEAENKMKNELKDKIKFPK